MQELMNFYEWFRWSSRSRNKSQWDVVLRFQSTCNDFKFWFHAEPRQTLASWHMEYIWITGKRFWFSIFYISFIPQSSSRNLLLYNTKRNMISSTSNRDRDFFTGDEKQNRRTIPIPTFAKRPPTFSSVMPVEIPQRLMVGQQRQKISEL